MKIFDIGKEMFHSEVYPGDPIPKRTPIMEIKKGDGYNLSAVYTGSHSSTHIDAPKHFLENGKAIKDLNLYQCIGNCTVAEADGILDGLKMEDIINHSENKLLLKGNAVITLEAAKVITSNQLDLIGTENITVGSEDDSIHVHLELLSHEIIILESLSLTGVPAGNYFLCAPPINYGDSDGAPSRPILIDFDH